MYLSPKINEPFQNEKPVKKLTRSEEEQLKSPLSATASPSICAVKIRLTGIHWSAVIPASTPTAEFLANGPHNPSNSHNTASHTGMEFIRPQNVSRTVPPDRPWRKVSPS